MHYAIIGNGVAGINAANTIRNREEAAEISIVSYETDHFFSRTALMYVACGQLSEKCVEPFERDHYERMRFTRVKERVSALDTDRQSLKLAGDRHLTYDKLLIASGSLAVPPPWPGMDLDGVGHFVTWQDMQWLTERSGTARKAVVVGGGLIGIECAEVLSLGGVDVSFLIREPYYWPVALDENEGTIVADHMRRHGCDVRLNTEVEEIVGRDGAVTGVHTKAGETIDCDMVVVAIGVRPQTDFLRDSGLEFGERGGIVVDEYLRTNLDNVWAAGDCTSVVWFNGVRRPEQLWYTSRDQGRVVGCNMTGDNRRYERGLFYNSAKFFEIEYTTAGYVNFNFEGEQSWFQHEPGTYFTTRLVYLPDRRLIGFNGLGRRWDHTIFLQWIREKRTVDYAIDHLAEALFDEEFMPTFRVVAARP
ncbi:NAD(P)/FAD-dependent oxidoreductase [candidate division GN15 bacterium]|nr:NAD(P)/FAD-dependent oxidoreductase [candidate division GN15 bacterium]